jgi:L-serine dehydratase
VLPAVLKYHRKVYKVSLTQLYKALATAGLIGNLVKHNASISGAEVGCQGEIGTACAMASAAATQMMGGTTEQVEYSAEMGLEHHLGLTCDPVAGLVQIPCIERNAMAAERALAHNTYALMSDGQHRISFDDVVETMYQTGKDVSNHYKETSIGGLARIKNLRGEGTG